MNPRKRPAAEPLLPLHAPKQPRTKMVGYDGGNPSPSEPAGIASRWKRVFKDAAVLAFDSVKAMVNFIRPASDDLLPVHGDVQICPEPTKPPDNETRLGHPDLHSSTHHVAVAINDSHLHESSRIPTQSIQSSTSQNPIPSFTQTSSTIHHSKPSTIYGGRRDLPLDSAPSSSKRRGDGQVARRYRNREHIYAKEHKASVRAEKQKVLEAMQRKMYTLERNRGYTSNFTDFKGYLTYKARLEKVDQQELFSPSHSMADLHTKEALPSRRQRSYSDVDQVEDEMEFLRRAFDRARATLNEPRPPRPFQPTLDNLRLSHRARDELIEQHLRPKRVPPSPLPAEANAEVDAILAKRGVVAKFSKEQVNAQDLSRLNPSQWLNDEIINFYGAMILARSDDCKENVAQGGNGKKLLNVHYFSTFFWTKLKEGYDKSRLAKWTKKFDIFSKDVVLIPINHSNAHWTGAAINFRQKRIESYDSMGMRRDNVFKLLRLYLDAEHMNKKKKPFDFAGWEDYSLEEPQQENGFDCGVFTCQFLQGLSRGEEYITFTQKDMLQLRRRMIWEIGNAKLRDDP